MKQYKFWKKVRELGDTDPLTYAVSLAKHYKLKEIRHYETLVDKYKSTKEILLDHQNKMRAQIRTKAEKSRSRYISYMFINPHLESPSLYNTIYGEKNVSTIAKLRTITHNLQIDMGRRTATPRENRKCHCGDVEDEDHFLLRCDAYQNIRRKYSIFNTTISAILNNSDLLPYIIELYKERSINI